MTFEFKSLFEQKRDAGNVQKWITLTVNEVMDPIWQKHLLQKSPWLQFSGCFDQQKTKLFVGDVIKLGNTFFAVNFGEYPFKDNMHWGFYLESIPDKKYVTTLLDKAKIIECVGSIYEKHLLPPEILTARIMTATGSFNKPKGQTGSNYHKP